MSGRPILWAPLVAFILLAAFLTYGLAKPDDTNITSKMVGAAVPPFRLPPATPGMPGLASADLAAGKPHLVNIFASWCVPCAAEAPQLRAIADAGVPIVGIAVRDRPEALADFLHRYGNPYARIGSDNASQVQMALGSSGVPETFVVDGRGMIRRQTIGPINPQDVADTIAAVQAAR
ncbi:redoxin family protein [Sphingomonas nostoxanthinifaciens]|uniref:redoxin family protein n=1 Tax=Sphingomonas nostoxanthinifaciens TaxID=2872652 RepID=UPI001CC1E370|nr:redoxin family protein [Sphingomonas nostoxanthinifaciens]UAK26347.1 redoxin family protein [Sphingomonas nostoxanthinifaciens]